MPHIMTSNKNILVVAGDASADMHGSSLIKELKKIDPELSISSIGGVRMQAVSNHLIYNLVSHGAIGFSQTFKSMTLWVKLIQIIRRYLEERKPLCVIAIDFYGFNHQVLGLCKHRNIPVYYYIPPQVWASRPGRAKTISALAKEIFAIFPFEPEIYKKHKGNVSFFGHPLLDIIPEVKKESREQKDQNHEWKIGILPGSRKTEIARHLPVFLDSFYEIKSVYKNARAYVFAVPEFSDKRIYDIISSVKPQSESEIEIIREFDYKRRAEMDFCFTCSGTATLENALLGIPMVVAYKMPRLNYEIARRIVKIPYISLVNILLKKPVVREFIQAKADSKHITQEAFSIMNNPHKYASLSRELLSVKKLLGEKPVAGKIAAKILGDFNLI
ncbi:MAG: lipid-A-disaccharide synthase [Elusimicrobia bacterium CG08_land_8_20_14_0_20_51_18]|nr:MAG: lipid-A-disaccharide synthase [Elusimicrobia bacterium CG08_land_8_20_14_0_20_51_18]